MLPPTGINLQPKSPPSTLPHHHSPLFPQPCQLGSAWNLALPLLSTLSLIFIRIKIRLLMCASVSPCTKVGSKRVLGCSLLLGNLFFCFNKYLPTGYIYTLEIFCLFTNNINNTVITLIWSLRNHLAYDIVSGFLALWWPSIENRHILANLRLRVFSKVFQSYSYKSVQCTLRSQRDVKTACVSNIYISYKYCIYLSTCCKVVNTYYVCIVKYFL